MTRQATDEARSLIERGELTVLGLLPRASNYVFLAEVSDGERRALAVYKPRRGEAPLWDFPDGTLCQREVAAYVLARALGWPRVPPTVLREGPHGPGSVQLFVRCDPREHFFTLRDRFADEFRAVAAFDVVANNADRKAGHCLLGEDGRVWVVDHGVCFNVEPKLRTVIWDFAGEPLPAALRRDVARVAQKLRSGPLRGELLELLSPEEVDATAHRAQELAASGRFPEPRAARPYPWPPV
ncbi:MAG TPA: SCO1664 family protein [Actinomycetota bacterium]|nr:SCO1664 family protein [Actinomycetota bacterium]